MSISALLIDLQKNWSFFAPLPYKKRLYHK